MLESLFDTVDVPTSEEVDRWAAKQDSSNAPHRSDPLWALVLIFIGALVLIGAGAFIMVTGLQMRGLL